MDHYIDIHVLPDPEFSPPMLMSALFAKLHRGLVDYGQGDIGISFPDVEPNAPSLGGRLRLHGRKNALDRLMAQGWLQGMGDHAKVLAPSPVPDGVRHRAVRRVQAKSGPERLRRRLMKRKGLDHAAAEQAIPDEAAERLRLPYVSLASRSTKQRFRLFIEHSPLQDEAQPGRFTSYGLSPTSTIPWF